MVNYCAVQVGHYDGSLFPSLQLAQCVQCAAVYMCIFVYLNIQLRCVSQCAEYCIVEEVQILLHIVERVAQCATLHCAVF